MHQTHLVVSENQDLALARWRQLRLVDVVEKLCWELKYTPKPSSTWEVNSNLWFRLEGTVPCIFGGCLRLLHFSHFCKQKMARVHVVSQKALMFDMLDLVCEFCDLSSTSMVACFGGKTCLYWTRQVQVVFRVFTCFVHCFFQDEAVLSVIITKAARIPAFDVVCWV